ncbi:MAG TPA: hypothetical protein VM537_27875, partial [Anaerolineae bacterium]|nr:hypothetical protein [Anaerolineae bacterium]
SPGGPAFEWVDISQLGTELVLGDDEWVGPLAIGFGLPYYDEVLTDFYISSNGWLSLARPAGPDFSNERLPSAEAPSSIIAMFWDDLNPTAGGKVLTYSNGRELVVTFDEIYRYGSGGPHTFQAILTSHGTITLQYKHMLGGRLNESTIGIQNVDGSQGLTVAYNQAYVHDGLAVRIRPPASPHEISYQARLVGEMALNSVVTNTALLTVAGGQTIELSASVGVNQVDLRDSEVVLNPAIVAPGERLTCTITLKNTGNVADAATVRVPIPEHSTYIDGSADGGATYDAGPSEVHWQGTVEPGGDAVFRFSITARRPAPDGTHIEALAIIDDGAHIHGALQRVSAALISAPDLSRSSKRVQAEWIMVGQPLSYTVEIRNEGSRPADVRLRDPLQEGTLYVAGSGWAGSGSEVGYDELSHTLHWQGVVPAKGIALLRFSTLPLGVTTARNSATVDDGFGVATELSTSSQVYFPYERLFLPVMRSYVWQR